MLTEQEKNQINELLHEMDDGISEAKGGVLILQNLLYHSFYPNETENAEACKAMEFTCDSLNTLLTRKLTTLIDRIWEITRRE